MVITLGLTSVNVEALRGITKKEFLSTYKNVIKGHNLELAWEKIQTILNPEKPIVNESVPGNRKPNRKFEQVKPESVDAGTVQGQGSNGPADTTEYSEPAI